MLYAILIIGFLIVGVDIARVRRVGERILRLLERESEKREKEEGCRWLEELDRGCWSSSYDEFDELEDDTDSQESKPFVKKTLLERMEDELAGLKESEKWGLVPKKDLGKHKKEIYELQKQINEIKNNA